MTDSLGTALPAEIDRVQNEVMPTYMAIGLSGMPALMLMRADVYTAITALAEGDLVAMILAFQKLKEWKV